MRKVEAMLLAVLIAFLAGCCYCPPVPPPGCTLPQGTWELASTSPKVGALGEAVVGTGDSIYVIRAHSIGTWNFWLYSPSTDQWTDLAVPPERPKTGTALAWDGGEYIYALLGASYSDASRTYFYRYHIPSDSWSALPDTPAPQGAGDALTWCGFDNKLYAFIGNNQLGSQFAAYDPATGQWTVQPFNPNWSSTDDGASLAWTGGEWIYALAGEWEETVPHQDFARYHIPTQTWEELPLIPDPGGIGDGASLLWIGQWIPDCQACLFALGGGSAIEDPGYGFYVFDTSREEWTTLDPLPCPVGYWVGNRLAFAVSAIWYWQGTPSTWECGGNKLYKLPVQ